MKTLKNQLKALWKDESAQGATEYILLLVAVVTLVMMFRGKLTSIIQGLTGTLDNEIGKFNQNP